MALVNNAGGHFPAPLAAINQKGFRDGWYAPILSAAFWSASEVFNQSMSKTGGRIVNIARRQWGACPGMGHSGACTRRMETSTRQRRSSGRMPA